MMWWMALMACRTQEHLPDERPADACEAGKAREVVFDVTRPERKRRGLLWIPEGPGPHDVIVNLHEYRSEPRRQAHYTHWVELAKAKNAYLLGPDGKSSMWNAGGCCGKAKDQGIDDVGFLDAAIEKLDRVGCTSGKVLATGIGNGGMMAQAWACQSDVVDAVVSVGGGLQMETCSQTRPIPVLMYHGTEDTWIPMDGSGHHLTLEHAETVWRARNQATGVPVVSTDGVLNCTTSAGGADVTVCRVSGMKDHWPGAEDAPLDDVKSPLSDATVGAFEWIRARW